MHSQSEVSYTLGGRYRLFHARVGIDDETAGGGSVLFRVLGDGKQLFVSDVIRGNDRAVQIGPLRVEGVKTLTLVVDFAAQGDLQDHADWCDAVLIK